MAEAAASDPHWAIKCNPCRQPVKYFCNTCGERLCTFCREYHLKSRLSSDHDVVLFVDKTELHLDSLSYCKNHISHRYQLWCETCETPVCIKCTTEDHNTHMFCELKTIYKTKRKQACEALHELRNAVLPRINKQKIEISDLIQEHEKDIQHLDKELIQEGEYLKSLIDEKVAERRFKLEQYSFKCVTDLRKEEDDCRKEYSQVKSTIEDLENRLRHEDQIKMLKFDLSRTNYTLQAYTHDFTKPRLPQLRKRSNQIEDIEDIRFNTLTFDDNDLLTQSNVTRSAQQDESCQSLPSIAGISRQKKQIQDEPSLKRRNILVSKIHTTAPAPTISCLPNQRAWMETEPNITSMVDIHGNIFHSVSLPPSNFIATGEEKIVVISYDEKCVKEITTANDNKTLFALPFRPTGICFSTDGHIVIAFHEGHTVIKYNKKGTEVAKYTSVRFPYKVTVNKETQDICINSKADLSTPGCTGRVIALCNLGKVTFEYRGQDPDTFSPVELVSDPEGRIFIVDTRGSQIHIVDRHGSFLGYLWINEEQFVKPINIDCDKEGHIWIGEMNGNVKVVKYFPL